VCGSGDRIILNPDELPHAGAATERRGEDEEQRLLNGL
jgi:hypothetical protein